MSGCDCHAEAGTPQERKILIIALVLNAAMFVIDLMTGILAQSTSLIADSLDMFADASAYGIALAAIGRSAGFKASAARLSGTVLLALGLGAVLEVFRRAIHGSEPVGSIMFGVALLALAVNTTVLKLLAKHKKGEVHLRATWIFTRADVVANLGVLAAAALVQLSGSPLPDLAVGLAIGLYVTKEALEILREARGARHASHTERGS